MSISITTKGFFIPQINRGGGGPAFHYDEPKKPEPNVKLLSLKEENKEQNIGVSVKNMSEENINGDK